MTHAQDRGLAAKAHLDRRARELGGETSGKECNITVSKHGPSHDEGRMRGELSVEKGGRSGKKRMSSNWATPE